MQSFTPFLHIGLPSRTIMFSPRPVVIARELTKLHEEVFHGTLAEAVEKYGGAKEAKGEFTIVLGPQASPPGGGVEEADRMRHVESRCVIGLGGDGLEQTAVIYLCLKGRYL